MKKFVQNLAVKIIAFILLIILCFSLAVSVVGVILLIDSNVYVDGGEKLIERVYAYYENEYIWTVKQKLNDKLYGYDTAYYTKELYPEKINFRYIVRNENNERIDSNFINDEEVKQIDEAVWNMFVPSDLSTSVHYAVLENYDDYYNPSSQKVDEYLNEFQKDGDKLIQSYDSNMVADGSIMLEIRYRNGRYVDYHTTFYVLEEPTKKDYLPIMLGFADFALSIKDAIFVFIGLSLLLSLVLVIVLVCGAGHKNGVEGIHLSKYNKIPFDLFLAIHAFLFALLIIGFDVFGNSDIGVVIYIVCATPAFATLLMSVVLSFSARIKTNGILKNTVIYRLVRVMYRLTKKVFNLLGKIFSKIPLFYKALLAIIAITFVEILFFIMGLEDYIILWLFEKILLVPAVIYVVLCMRRLQISARKIAGGQTDYKTDTKYLVWDFKEHAENLNGISNGLSLAVEESVKSERTKAELITNVSHDIKTPLTSIINYVDLLKKEGINSENANEYLSVLERQSARLKRLTEDLVEASKASTGNISINLEKTDMNVLLSQTAGEYEERLSKNNLSVVLDLSDEELVVDADGRRMWRVFDNLMNNICKYAQPNTRVYLTSRLEYGKAVISFKNISKEPLNITPDELTERFVRGDKSRNTEGSGLGLSIAKSLVELQGGIFNIQIDGDLFKVTIAI